VKEEQGGVGWGGRAAIHHSSFRLMLCLPAAAVFHAVYSAALKFEVVCLSTISATL
jgi:hypothetical protein